MREAHPTEEVGRSVTSLKRKRRPAEDLLERARRLWADRRLPARARIVVVEQLARLLRAGIPIVQAIDEIHATVSDRRLGGALSRLREAVEGGDTLGEAMKRAESLFPPVERGAVEAGEKTGRLADVLDRVATGWRRSSEFRRRLVVGAVYPSLLLVLSAFLMPLTQLFFQGVEAYLLEVLSSLVWVLLAGMALLALKAATSLFGWQDGFRKVAWWLPGLRSIYRRKVWSDLYHGLALSFSAGLGIHESLEIVLTSVQDPTATHALRETSAKIEAGQEFTEALGRTGILSPAAMVALAGAERSGTLEESLTRLSEDQARELDQMLKVVLAVANVVLLLVVVGWVAMKVLGSATSILPGGGGSFDELEKELMKEAPFKMLL